MRRRATRHLFTAPTVLKCGGRGRRGEEARQGSCLTLCDSRCCGGEPLGCFLPSLVRPSSRCARPRAAARPPARWRVVPSFCSLPNAENETLSESESDGPPFYPSAARVLPFVVRCAVGRRRGGRQEERKKEGATHSGESGRSHFIVALVAIPAVGADYRIGVRILILA